MMNAPGRQRGVALLVALLIVALAVILIAALLDRGELMLARTRNALRSEQAEAYALGLEAYAAQVLLASHASGPGADTHTSPWALPLPARPVPGGSIGARMVDLNGCLNLNNLASASPASTQWMQVFRALLDHNGVDEAVATSVRTWLDGTDVNADANYYLAQPVPYRARGDLFVHVSELRLVRGVNGAVYARLAPDLCALPPGSKLNVNTASVAVLWSLSALAPAITQPVAQKVWRDGQANYPDLAASAQEAGIQASALPADMFAVTSSYFRVRGDVLLDDVPFTFYSVIQFLPGDIRVIARSRGSDDALVAAAPMASQEHNE